MAFKNPYSFKKSKESFMDWVNSCTTSEQLNLLLPLIEPFVIKPFEKEITEMEGIMAKEDLVNAINDRKTIVVKNNPPISIPTLDSYLQDDNFKEVIN